MSSTRPRRNVRNPTVPPPIVEDDTTVVRNTLDRILFAVDVMARYDQTREDVMRVHRGETTKTFQQVIAESRWHEGAVKARKECPLGSMAKKKVKLEEEESDSEEDDPNVPSTSSKHQTPKGPPKIATPSKAKLAAMKRKADAERRKAQRERNKLLLAMQRIKKEEPDDDEEYQMPVVERPPPQFEQVVCSGPLLPEDYMPPLAPRVIMVKEEIVEEDDPVVFAPEARAPEEEPMEVDDNDHEPINEELAAVPATSRGLLIPKAELMDYVEAPEDLSNMLSSEGNADTSTAAYVPPTMPFVPHIVNEPIPFAHTEEVIEEPASSDFIVHQDDIMEAPQLPAATDDFDAAGVEWPDFVDENPIGVLQQMNAEPAEPVYYQNPFMGWPQDEIPSDYTETEQPDSPRQPEMEPTQPVTFEDPASEPASPEVEEQPIEEPANSEVHEESVLVPAESEEYEESVLVPAESEEHEESVLVPAESDEHEESVLVPAGSEEYEESVLVPAESEEHEESVLVPAESDEHEESVFEPASSEEHEESVLVPAESDEHEESVFEPASSEEYEESVLVPAESDEHEESVSVPTGSEKHEESVSGPAESEEHEESELMPVDSEEHMQQILEAAESPVHQEPGIEYTQSELLEELMEEEAVPTVLPQPEVRPVAEPVQEEAPQQPIVETIPPRHDPTRKFHPDICEADEINYSAEEVARKPWLAKKYRKTNLYPLDFYPAIDDGVPGRVWWPPIADIGARIETSNGIGPLTELETLDYCLRNNFIANVTPEQYDLANKRFCELLLDYNDKKLADPYLPREHRMRVEISSERCSALQAELLAKKEKWRFRMLCLPEQPMAVPKKSEMIKYINFVHTCYTSSRAWCDPEKKKQFEAEYRKKIKDCYKTNKPIDVNYRKALLERSKTVDDPVLAEKIRTFRQPALYDTSKLAPHLQEQMTVFRQNLAHYVQYEDFERMYMNDPACREIYAMIAPMPCDDGNIIDEADEELIAMISAYKVRFARENPVILLPQAGNERKPSEKAIEAITKRCVADLIDTVVLRDLSDCPTFPHLAPANNSAIQHQPPEQKP